MSERYSTYHKKAQETFALKTGVKIDKNPADLINQQGDFDYDCKPEIREIFPGVTFEKGSITLKDGAGVNFFDVSFPQETVTLAMDIKSQKFSTAIRRILINDTSSLAAINGGFLFLADRTHKEPVDLNFNLCIRENKVVGLPIADRAALTCIDGVLEVSEYVAEGTIRIAGVAYSWKGNRSAHASETSGILYNSASCTIEHHNDESGAVYRQVIQEKNFTPEEAEVVDIVFGLDDTGNLKVVAINEGGGTDFFDGSSILQMDKTLCQIQIGDTVNPETLDGVDLKRIDSALTIGPNAMHFLNNKDHPINHDASLGSNPAFPDKRKAHSLLFLDTNGNLHMRVFDGAPKSDTHQGITPHEVAELMQCLHPVWAYHLDGGQSSQIDVQSKDDAPEIYGSLHYIRHPKNTYHQTVWSGERKNPSAIVLKRRG